MVATYLDPAHKVFLTSAELVLVKEYLRRFVLPGLAGFSVPAISPSLLTTVDEVEKDIQLYEHKATLHMLHVSTRAAEMTREAREGVERVKVLPVQCPLAFWFSQVMLAVSSRGPRRLRF